MNDEEKRAIGRLRRYASIPIRELTPPVAVDMKEDARVAADLIARLVEERDDIKKQNQHNLDCYMALHDDVKRLTQERDAAEVPSRWRDALALAYRVLTDKRQTNRYGISFGLSKDDGTLYTYYEMLDDFVKIYKYLFPSSPSKIEEAAHDD